MLKHAITACVTMISIGCGMHAASVEAPVATVTLEALEGSKPNIVLLVLDEWGYYETSHLGHPDILTPNIDKMSEEGMRFTQLLAGAPVCGPTRATIMLGQHSGHASMRTNGGAEPIRADDVTIATLLKQAGYNTGGFGKWGIGGRGTSGEPTDHGFDTFFGYYHQVHAHSYYPPYLIHNGQEVPLEGNNGDPYNGNTHAHVEIHEAAMEWLGEQTEDTPFFLYLPYTIPHGYWGFPKDDPSWELFADKPWRGGQVTDEDSRVYAAMMHMADRQVGEIRAMLKEKGMSENTIIIVSGDNGGDDYFADAQHPRGLFAPNVDPVTGQEWRGRKRDLYEGGLRVPFYVVWPGAVPAGTINDHLGYFPDFMPTFCELAGIAPSPTADGISFLPTLLHSEGQAQHEYLYWELGKSRAVRFGDWKAIYSVRRTDNPKWELFNLSTDPSETIDLSAEHPEILAQMQTWAEEAHVPARQGETYRNDLNTRDRNAGSAPR